MDDLDRIYLFGAHCYRVPSPPLGQVVEDMQTMKRLGMNLANFQISWSWCNPDDGKYDFGDLVTLLAESDRIGLFASITLTMEQMPKWVWDTYPDCRLMNARGNRIEDPTQYVLPADGKPGPCWDHTGVRREARRFLDALMETTRGFKHIAYWNLWQEISLAMVNPGASGPDRNVPFNPETLDAFRDWLKARHASLEALNNAWGTRFPSWERVEPPRLYTKVPSFMDWRRFVFEGYLPAVVEERKRVIQKGAGSPTRVAFHTCHPLFGAAWEFAWSRLADYYGTSFYPTTQLYHGWEHPGGMLEEVEDRRHELWSSLYHLNYGRCTASGPTRYLISEMACGPYNVGLHVKGDVTREDLRRWLLLQIAAGSQGVVLWNTRPEIFWDEAQGQGFLDGNGGLTPRAEALREFGDALKRHSDLLANSRKPVSPVGIGVDDDTSLFLEGSDAGVHANMPLRGVYEALLTLGVDPDFVDVNRSDGQALARRRMLFMPFAAAMAERTVRKLAAYVEAGGVLVSGPTPARFSEYGWAYQSGMSPEAELLFGVRQKSLCQVAEESSLWRWTPKPGRAGDLRAPVVLKGTAELESLALRASFYVQTFEPVRSRPVLRVPEPGGRNAVAGVMNRRGNGRVYLFGTMFAYASLSEGCHGTRAALGRILDSIEVPRARQGEVVMHRRFWQGAELVSLVNLGSQAGFWRDEAGTPSLEDILTGEVFGPGADIPVPAHDLRVCVRRVD